MIWAEKPEIAHKVREKPKRATVGDDLQSAKEKEMTNETVTIENPDIQEEKVDYEALAKELTATVTSLKEEVEALKKANTNASADAAKWKREYRSTLDEAQRKEAEKSDLLTDLKAQLEIYKTNERIATYTAKLVDAGYDTDTAANMAKSLPEGIDESFFEGQKSFLENQKLKVKKESLGSQPPLTPGMPMSGKTAEQMESDKMRAWFGLPTK